MNRKQRRAAGHSSGRSPPTPVGATPAATLAQLFAAAVAQHQAGALAEAERRYRHILILFPDHAETHARLGAVLMAQGKITEATAQFERAVALKADLFEAHGNLAQAYLAAGQREAAVTAAARALALKETEPGKALLGLCIKDARFTADPGGRFRQLALRALGEGWARPRELTGVCISLVKLNPAVREAVDRANAAWPQQLPAGDLFASPAIAALSSDALLRLLLECDPITDVGLERLLTNLRCAMLASASALDQNLSGNEDLLAFFCGIARQCFINEYVFSPTEAEEDAVQRLRDSLETALAADRACPAFWPVVVGAYFPLHSLSQPQALLARPWPQSVAALLVQQVREPAEERRIAAAIPALTEIDGEVSRAVRRQYEESPYPRWAAPSALQQRVFLNQAWPPQATDVLIAGCGTGMSTIELARQARHARLLAIDLSLASLGYAKRIAQDLGLANIEFAQADIIKLGSIGRRFDFIDASGVLHHLADPWAGWRVLLSLLRPGGTMQIGLYSEAARRDIVAARALIAARGYRPVPQDIRRCREEIMAAPQDSPLKSLTEAADFFATSECRDMLFHVQERRITLPAIKSFLAANDVQFAGFSLDPLILRRFAARFPARAAMLDLDRWHDFETEAPDTFIGMYRFWLRKPAAAATR